MMEKFENSIMFNIYFILWSVWLLKEEAAFRLSENRSEFLEKLQRARSQMRSNMASQPILSHAGPDRIMVGNWSLMSKKEGELEIHNSDGQQVGRFRKHYLTGVHAYMCVHVCMRLHVWWIFLSKMLTLKDLNLCLLYACKQGLIYENCK